jgi:glycosyltransferase involved in cell wall biosynthesis
LKRGTVKILHIIPNLGVGGTEKILRDLCFGLGPARFVNAVVSLKSGGPGGDALRPLTGGVRILESPDSLLRGFLDMPRLYFRLKKIIQEMSPDIVHTWLARANFIGRAAARNSGARVVSSLRVMESEKTYHLWAERLTQKWSDVVTVNCLPLKDFAVRRIGIPEQKIRVIFNGIEIPPPAPFRRRDKGGGNGAVLFGAMGRLHKQKGMDVFLRASRLVSDKLPRCAFHIAGEGPEKKALQDLARSLGIEKEVVFHGLVEKTGEFFEAIDVFVLASRWEGMPNVILEAMASMKPVISSAVGGVTDLIKDRSQGLLVASEDPESLARAMTALAEDPGLGQNLAEAAYRKVADEFSLKKMVASYVSLYESLLQRS